MNPNDPRLISVRTAANTIGASVWTVRRLIHDGTFRARRLHDSARSEFRISKKSVDEYLKAIGA